MSKETLNTNTELRRSPGLIGIYTFYVEYDKNLMFFISNTEKTLNDVNFVEGELGYTNNNWENTSFLVNEKGELIVVSDEVDGFEINENGELEYTE